MIKIRNSATTKSIGNVALVLLLTVIFCASLSAQEDSGFYKRQQAGIRLGGWLNQGGLPIDTSSLISADIGNNSFYAEVYGAWRIFDRGYLEVSFGFANRGDISTLIYPETDSSVTDSTSVQFYGNLIMYPVTVQLKYYLPGFRSISFKPFIEGGAGIYIGRHSVTFTDSRYTFVQEPSSTKLSYVVGAGFDWPLSKSIGIELCTRYFPIKFGGEGLFDQKDYSAVAVTVGVKYMFIPTKKKHANRPKR